MSLTITEWAAIAEIVGMVTVVASLLLVVHSIRQNTAAMHTSNDNFIYERQDYIIFQQRPAKEKGNGKK